MVVRDHRVNQAWLMLRETELFPQLLWQIDHSPTLHWSCTTFTLNIQTRDAVFLWLRLISIKWKYYSCLDHHFKRVCRASVIEVTGYLKVCGENQTRLQNTTILPATLRVSISSPSSVPEHEILVKAEVISELWMWSCLVKRLHMLVTAIVSLFLSTQQCSGG